jgi:hypothetical protein
MLYENVRVVETNIEYIHQKSTILNLNVITEQFNVLLTSNIKFIGEN